MKTLTSPTGEVRRVPNDAAKALVKIGWRWTAKSVWKAGKAKAKPNLAFKQLRRV